LQGANYDKAFNRTSFGIEIFCYDAFFKSDKTFNRTSFGIEIYFLINLNINLKLLIVPVLELKYGTFLEIFDLLTDF